MRVLDAAHARPDLPVARGFATPLIEPTHFCPAIHGEDSLGDLSPPLPPSARRVVPEHAVQVLLAVLRAEPSPITVIALAPLTNIAVAFRTDPELCRAKIERVVWMGGSAFAGGNHSAWGEASGLQCTQSARRVHATQVAPPHGGLLSSRQSGPAARLCTLHRTKAATTLFRRSSQAKRSLLPSRPTRRTTPRPRTSS